MNECVGKFERLLSWLLRSSQHYCHTCIAQVVAADNGFGRGNFSLSWRVLDPDADAAQRCSHHSALGKFGNGQCDTEINSRFCDWDGVRMRPHAYTQARNRSFAEHRSYITPWSAHPWRMCTGRLHVR